MFVKKKLLATLSLLLLLLSILSAISQKSNWIAFDAAIDEPVKTKVEVLESNASKTVLSIAVPGMEVSEQLVAGQVYQRLNFPDYGTTTVKSVNRSCR